MKWVFAGWAALVLVVGVLVTALTAGGPTEEEKVAAAERAKRPPAELTDPRLVSERVQEIRGQGFVAGEPEVEVVPETQIEQALSQLDQPQGGAGAQREQRLEQATQLLLTQAGAVPPQQARQLSQRHGGPGALGAWVPTQKKVLLSRELVQSDPQTAEQVLAHELFRAVEGEAVKEVPRRPRPFREDEAVDVALAVGAATAGEREYATEHLGVEPPVESIVAERRVDETVAGPRPPALQTYAAFPATSGVALVGEVFEQDGWEAVDELRNDPPASSSEILHPDVDATPEEPPTLALRGALGRGWQRLATAEVGELDTLAMLSAGVERDRAQDAARGWRAGRFESWGKGQQAQQCPPPCRKSTVSVAVWRFADETESQEFQRAMRRSLQSAAKARPEGGRGFRIEDGGAALVRVGRFAALSFAPDAQLAGRLAQVALEED